MHTFYYFYSYKSWPWAKGQRSFLASFIFLLLLPPLYEVFSPISKIHVIISTALRPSQERRGRACLGLHTSEGFDALVLFYLCLPPQSYELEEELVTLFYSMLWVLGTLEFSAQKALRLLPGLPS